jgi:DNA-nicking Smr family endonuclease
MARKDVDLFAAAMADVKPLGGRRRGRPAPDVPPKPSPSLPPPLRGGGGPKGRRGEAVKELALDDHNFDRDIARALGRGKLVPQASLDLHGMTLAAAERAVSRFLDQATAQDLRVVLIVTGKGLRLEGGRMLGGRIRAEFLDWLNRADNRARLRGVRPAHPRHGGSGAFYVLLRRRSSASNRSLRTTPQR